MSTIVKKDLEPPNDVGVIGPTTSTNISSPATSVWFLFPLNGLQVNFPNLHDSQSTPSPGWPAAQCSSMVILQLIFFLSRCKNGNLFLTSPLITTLLSFFTLNSPLFCLKICAPPSHKDVCETKQYGEVGTCYALRNVMARLSEYNLTSPFLETELDRRR